MCKFYFFHLLHEKSVQKTVHIHFFNIIHGKSVKKGQKWFYVVKDIYSTFIIKR